ncbi:aldehyde dehydrogenase family protein [Glaciecola sp. MH2013]|uniref:aldehyde dehydrogenase family protein n=1 Tax=Glaciecola sp. MH2013 TaxID=2785524 RepID=UPI00189D94B6|nr:aldehyde dehydrogenase family protein [Glaciecola sp. MH2013]MBF7074006.1 aldehyde dehydrogenase family protein [Glaciecola sp. MH2013]
MTESASTSSSTHNHTDSDASSGKASNDIHSESSLDASFFASAESLSVESIEPLKRTFASGRTKAYDWRIAQLTALKKLLTENTKEITKALHSDLGKSDSEAWLTEIGYSIHDVDDNIKKLKSWMKPKKVSTPMVAWPSKSFVIAEPLGVALIIGAWNYPFQLVVTPLIAAIAAGNCAVIKPSELSEATSELLSKLIPKYLDNTAFRVQEGGKDETTELLAMPFDKYFYTGGEQVGRIVMTAAAKHLAPVTLELGGKSPCVVDGETNLEVAIRRIVWGKWMNAGQTCVAPDYLLIEEKYLADFSQALIAEIKKQYSEKPKANKDYGRIINQRHCARLISYLDGVNVIHGGKHDVADCYIEPTVVIQPATDASIMQEEIFGPLLPILTFKSKQSMTSFIKSRPKPLAAYLFTSDKAFETSFIEDISAGSICVNDTNIFLANHELPFGGVGTSGMGSYHGKAGFDTFSHQKAVMKRGFRFDFAVRYAPFSKLKLMMLKRL